MVEAAPVLNSGRLQSLDVLRGLTVAVMLFVNDLAGVTGAPAWMKHVSPSTADGMTFVDVVFPAFLFIVGLSMPLALERRFARGETVWQVASHLGGRTLSLLVIGLFMVNSEEISDAGWLDYPFWPLLLYLAVMLVWTRSGRRVWGWPRIAGVALLVALAFAYRGKGEAGLLELRPHWWGILGLIGWAYLVAGVLYLFARRNAVAYAVAVPLLYCVYLAHGVGFFGDLLKGWISIGSMLGSHAAITTSGVVLGLTLLPGASGRERFKAALLLGAAMVASGVLLHSLSDLSPLFIYNKNAATPPWCLVSSGFTAWLFALAYWLVDSFQRRLGTRTLATAGQNALFAFILGPIAYALMSLMYYVLGGFWGRLGASFATGLPRSLLFAALATWFTAWLHRRGWTLRV